MAQSPAIGVYVPEINPQESMPRKVTPEMSPVSLGPAIENLGQLLDDKQRKDGAVIAANKVSEIRMRQAQREEQQKLAAQQNPSGGTDNFAGNAREEFDKDVNGVLSDLKNHPRWGSDYAAQLLEQMIPGMRADVFGKALNYEAGANVANRIAGTLDAGKKAAAAVEQDPDSWQKAGSEQMGALNAQGLPAEQRLMLGRQIDGWISEAAGNGYAKRDPQGTLGRLVDPNDPLFSGMTPEARARVEQLARGHAVQNQADAVVNVYRNQGPVAGAKAFANVDSLPLPDDLKDHIRRGVESGLDQLQGQRRQQYAQQIIPLEEGIAAGKPPANARAQVWDLHNKGAFGPQETATKLAQLDRIAQSNAADDANLQWVSKAYTDGRPLDPASKDVKDAVTGLFTHLAGDLQAGTPEWINRGADIASRTGVIPEPVVSWSRAQLVGGTPDQAVKAAEALARVQEATPRGAGFAVDEKTHALVKTIKDAVDAGTPAVTAVEVARQNANLPESQRKIIEERWRQLKTDAATPGALRELLKGDERYRPGLFTGVPDVPDALEGEFNELSHDYYLHTGGNLAQAHELAAEDLKRKWGVTGVNGKRELMPYAPEQMFPGLTADVVRRDVAASIEHNGIAVDPSKVHLTATDDTARTSGQVWALTAPDKVGAYDVLRGRDQQPLRYQLPVSPGDYAAVRERMVADAMAHARQVQAQQRDAEKLRMQALDEEMKSPIGWRAK
ncbi:MAG TPA: hypothetical protein VES65_11305 [Solirubrobacteraceae bacterium]|nr:hypothetical protein [Solirubrobacteraceae bacterium]